MNMKPSSNWRKQKKRLNNLNDISDHKPHPRLRILEGKRQEYNPFTANRVGFEYQIRLSCEQAC